MPEVTEDIIEGYMPQVDVARHYRVSSRTIRNWERRKLITGQRVGGVKLYPRAATAQNEVNRFGGPDSSAPFRSFPLISAASKEKQRKSTLPRRRSLASASMGDELVTNWRTMKLLEKTREELLQMERDGTIGRALTKRGQWFYRFADVFRLIRAGLPDVPPPTRWQSSMCIERGRPSFTYFVQAVEGGLIKIGITQKLEQRLVGLQSMCPIPLRCLGVIDGDKEERLHLRFAHLRRHGEWFEPAKELLEYVCQNARPA